MSAVQMLTPGSVVGNYEIIETIAQGGMGVVYHARHRSIRREVALKVLFPHLANDAEFTQRFQREGQAMATLRHPNIVEVYDAGFADGYYYMAIELLPGGSLHQQLTQLSRAQQMMPVEQALRITKEVAQALEYAHQKGFVHRDIKPSNVLIAADGRYVLTDFGIVHAEGATKLTRNLTTLGTPEYMSPEQAQGLPVDGRSDIYSLGIVLYEMLAGKPPFSSDTPWATVYQHIQQPPPSITAIRSDLSPAVRDIVNRSLAKKADDRFQSAKEMAAAIERIIGVAPGVKAAAVESRKSGRGLLIVGILASLAIISAGAVLAISTLANSNNDIPASVATATATQPVATEVAEVLPSATPLRATATLLPTLTAEPTATATATLPPTETPVTEASATAEPPTASPMPATPTVGATITPPPALTPARPGQLVDFERPLNWRRGDEPHGTFAQSNEQAHDGTFSGKLTYNIPAVAKNYVVFLTDIRMSGEPTGLIVWVYGDGKGNFLHTWIKDATGQRRQYTFGRIYHTGWQQMVAMFDTGRGWPNVRIDGPESASLNYPLSLNALVLDVAADNSGSSGVVYLDEVTFTTRAITQSTPQPEATTVPGAAPDPGATPAPTQAVGEGTPTVAPENDFNFRNYTVGRENWGKPKSADGCSDFVNDEGVYLKYEVNLEIVNAGLNEISGWQVAAISNIGRSLARCTDIAGTAVIPVGGSTRIAFKVYIQDQLLSFVEIRTPTLTKRLCISDSGQSITPCQ